MAEEGAVQIPGFRIDRELGRGAMGVVYLAHETALNREVALKVLRAGFGDGEDLRARFEREVRSAARLRHPNIIPILSTGETQGRLWYAMEFVAGESLEGVLAGAPGGRLRSARAVRIVRDLARALHVAHAAGVTHRDVKPNNVMLVAGEAPMDERTTASRRIRRSWLREASEGRGAPHVDRPLLGDFGLAYDRTASKLSESGMLIGTPGYMAPEQFRGRAEDIGPHSDQWALGVLLYECITGRMPFPTSDLATLARMIGNEDPIPPSRLDPRIDRDLETISLKCLQKNPRDRYPDCDALSEDLGRWLREEPITARPPGPVRRLVAWGRRRPVAATVFAGLALLALTAGGVLVGFRISKARQVAAFERDAGRALADARWEDAERIYEDWISLDPGAAPPRDGRTKARGLRGIHAALDLYQQARREIARLQEERKRLTFLTGQALHGAEVEGGSGLGSERARGSEPWWMREPSYSARREIERLRTRIAQRWAGVGSMLAIARTLVDANARDAGETGESARAVIYTGAAAWHMDEWRVATAQGNTERAALHRVAVEQLDPETYAVELSGVREVRVLPGAPPGRAWLFRYEREGDVIARGGPRLLPIPYHPERGAGTVPKAYREAVARRLRGEGRRPVQPDVATLSRPLQSTPRFVETLGGRMRRARYEALLASSAYPLVTSDENAVGLVDEPLVLRLPPGRYLLLLRREGYVDCRLPFEVGRGEVDDIESRDGLLTEAPPGFAFVPAGILHAGSDDGLAPQAAPRRKVQERAFLAARFEVTYREYWEFLNDPRTLAEIERHRARELRFVPRSGGSFPRPEDAALPRRLERTGAYQPMDNPEHPASHLNLFDLVGYLTPAKGETEPTDEQYRELAQALRESRTVGWGYLRWRTERSAERARRAQETGDVQPDVARVRRGDAEPAYVALRFTLPVVEEWERVARGGDRRPFVYGDEREWSYFKGVRSRRQYAAPEPVGLFADDESVFGVRDLAGSVSEWTADWNESGGVFWVKGHSWGSQVPEDDRIAARGALAPGQVSSTVGIRLIVRELEPKEPK